MKHLLAFSILAACVAACSSDVTTDPPDGSGGTGNAGAGGDNAGGQNMGGQTSSTSTTGGGGTGGMAPTCTTADGPVLAVDELYMGDEDYQGNPSPQAWELYAFDLDGQTSTAQDLGTHCQPHGGATAATVADGANGVDNSWGKNLVPIFQTLAADFSDQVNATIDSGDYTILFFFEQLAGPDQTGVSSLVWSGAPLGHAPTWSESDCWPVRHASVSDASDIFTALTSYPAATVTSDSWSSNGLSDLLVELGGGLPIVLTIHEARIEAQLAADHQSATLGRIGGVLDVEELVEAFRDLAGTLDPSLCSGATFESVAEQVRQSADIMNDGTQDPTQVCNGISIGLGFTLARVGLGTVAPMQPPPPDPCP